MNQMLQSGFSLSTLKQGEKEGIWVHKISSAFPQPLYMGTPRPYKTVGLVFFHLIFCTAPDYIRTYFRFPIEQVCVLFCYQFY